MILALVSMATACGSEQTPDQDGSSETAPEEVLDEVDGTPSDPDDGGDGGRAFGSSDDAVIQVVETAFSGKNATATWDGSTLRVSMDGSADEPTASIPCLALEGIIADDEDATIVYDDGEIVCADRYDTD